MQTVKTKNQANPVPYLTEIVHVLRTNKIHCAQDTREQVVYALHKGASGEFYRIYGCKDFHLYCISIYSMKITPGRLNKVESYLCCANKELAQRGGFYIDKTMEVWY